MICPEKCCLKKAGLEKAGLEKAGPKKAGPKKAGSKKAGSKKAGSKKAGSKKAGPKKAGPKKAGPKKAGSKTAGTLQSIKVQSIRPEKKSTGALETQLSKKKPLENYKKIAAGAAGAAGLVGVGLGAAGLREWMRKLRQRQATLVARANVANQLRNIADNAALPNLARANEAIQMIPMENIADNAALPNLARANEAIQMIQDNAALPRPGARIFPEPRTRSQVERSLPRARSYPESSVPELRAERDALPRKRSLPPSPQTAPPLRKSNRKRFLTQHYVPSQSGMETRVPM
jgi:hypothetical protein